MDKITMKNMKFYGYHGVMPEEQVNGQDFLIDVDMYLDLKKAGLSDNLADSVDYSEVYGIIKNITKSNIFRLLEKLADSIAREILSRYEKIEEIVVHVKKPDAALTDAPLTGAVDWVGVEIKRSRDDL